MKRVIYLMIMGLFFMQLLSCESSDPTAPTDSTILLTADPQTVRPDHTGFGESLITAQVLNPSFNPVEGVGVIFSASPTGEFTSGGSSIMTNSNGRAQDTLKTNADTTVTARSGAASSDISITFGEGNQAPNTLLLSTPNPAKVDEDIVFDGSGSIDIDGFISNYFWEIFPDLDAPETVEGPEEFTLVRSYSQEQSIIVRLTLTDNDGAIDQDFLIQEVVDNKPPSANAGPDQTTKLITTSVIVQLDGGQSTDEDGIIVRYLWNCGNGTIDEGFTGDSIGTCRYFTTGDYNVLLTVYDNGNGTPLVGGQPWQYQKQKTDSDIVKVTVE